MYKIIGGDQKEYGPATEPELIQWIQEGRLNADTLAKAEESAEWKPLGTFPEFADALRHQPGAPPVLSVAQQTFQTGPQPTQPLRVGSCLARAFQLLSANFALCFAATFLVWMIGTVCMLLPGLNLLYPVLDGVFMGGLYLIFISRLRGQPVGVGDVFAGFGLGLGNLALAGLLTSLLSSLGFVLCVLPGIYLTVAWIFAIPLAADRRMDFWPAMELSRKVVSRDWFRVFGLLLIAFLPVILMHVVVDVKLYLAMIAETKARFGTASPGLQELASSFPQIMESISRVSVPLVYATKGVLLLTLPFATAAVATAYEDLFGSGKSAR